MNSEVLKMNAAQVNPISTIQFFVDIMLSIIFEYKIIYILTMCVADKLTKSLTVKWHCKYTVLFFLGFAEERFFL